MKLPIFLLKGLIFVVTILTVTILPVEAVTIAQQTTDYSSSLNVWESIQELGNNLSGTLQNFTFRVSTSRPNTNQFNFTALNSRIFDKDNNNSFVYACVTNSSDPLNGLTFTTTGLPSGYEDVTLDFSCRNYNFITGHRYLIQLSNANQSNSGSGALLLGSATYSGKPSTDYFTGGGVRYAFDNGICSPASYVYGSTSSNNGCNIFTTAKDDLYFVLNNNAPPPPPPRLPVIFIPGIGGSEMKASQDIIWSTDNGHGGIFSHGYTNNEKIWVNQDQAAALGDDDYFDVLRMNQDGVTSSAAIGLTGNLTSFGYGDIDNFFTQMGYTKGTNYFVFNYDWRKDVRSNQTALDQLIESAKTASGQTKVNLVTHSMGGLIARNYITDTTKASKVNKLIELGTPHLGAPSAIKAIVYGEPLGRWYFKIINIGVNGTEVKDVIQNFPSQFSLVPSTKYFDLYNNSDIDHPYPYRDDRDIDNNQFSGALNYSETKTLLTNLGYNMTVYNFGEQLHNVLDSTSSQTNGVKIYEIVGTAQPTLGQIDETWWITWPINLLPKTDEIYVNGDNTVPLYSASLKTDTQDLSGATKIYYVEQGHTDLVNASGSAMLTVKSILNDDNSLPTQVKDQKIVLEGQQLTLDDGSLDLYDDAGNHCGQNAQGQLEQNIPGVTCSSTGNTKQAFVKKGVKVKAKVTKKTSTTTKKTTNLKVRVYKTDQISQTSTYQNLPLPDNSEIDLTLDTNSDTPPFLSQGGNTIPPTSATTATDFTAPVTQVVITGTKDSSGFYTGLVIVTLTGTDSGSGILKTEYSLDNGVTVQTYVAPFTISTAGTTTLQVMSTDKSGNQEVPQTITFNIAAPTPSPTPTHTPDPTTTPTPSPTPTAVSSTLSPTVIPTNFPLEPVIARSQATHPFYSFIPVTPAVLGVTFKSPAQVNQEIRDNLAMKELDTSKQTFNGLLIVSGGIGMLTLLLLGFTLMPIRTFVFREVKQLFNKSSSKKMD